MITPLDDKIILINGRNYDWSAITIQFGHFVKLPLVGVEAIQYTIDRPSEHLLNTGGQIVGRQYRAKTCSASITLQMSEIEAITYATKQSDITLIKPFDIYINFIPLGGVPVFKILKDCQFLNNGIAVTQNNMNISVTLDIILNDIIEK